MVFPSLAVGALAHAHHASLYAGLDVPLNTPDPRAVYLRPGTRGFGSIKLARDLGGPGDFKWTGNPQYGYDIEKLYYKILG